MIIDSQMENRQVLMDYIKEAGTVDPTADNNWSISPIEGNVTVTFPSSPKAEAVAPANIKATGATDVRGFEIYNLDLKKLLQPQREMLKFTYWASMTSTANWTLPRW